MVKKIIKDIFTFLFKYKIFVLIIILGLFLRIYRLSDSTTFSWDQERDAFVIKQILIEKKPILIGPRVVNDQGFFLAPYFFYILLPFYFLFNLNPYAIILFIFAYNISFDIFSFFIIKKIYSSRIAHIFIFIWQFLPLAISIDIISWNPLLIPLLVIILFYILNFLNFNKIKNCFFLGLYLGFSFNIHAQLLILSLIAIIFLIIINKNKYIFLKKSFFLIIGFLFSFIPLLIFDLRHDFLNFNLLLNFLKIKSPNKNLFAFLPVWSNFISFIFYVKSHFFSILVWLIIILFLRIYHKKNILYKSILFTWIFFPILFMFYGKRPSEYYFNFTLPIIVLIISQIISKIKISNKFIFISVFIISFYSIFLKINNNHLNTFSLSNKINVVKYIKSIVGDQKFNLSYTVPYGQESGFSYLLDYYKIRPSGNINDPLIEIIIPAQKEYKSFGDLSIKLPYPFNN